jgi:hypothetical protein
MYSDPEIDSLERVPTLRAYIPGCMSAGIPFILRRTGQRRKLFMPTANGCNRHHARRIGGVGPPVADLIRMTVN